MKDAMDGQADGKLDGDWTGSPIEDLDTPALLLDRAAADRNLQRMADFFRDRPCQLRPHFKNHKCVTLARRQLAAGSAVGMTCAKLGEAEVLAEHGFTDLLVANQVVGRRKLERLVQVARRADVKVAVDALGQAEAISRAAAAAGVEIGVLIEVDIGMGRCGVPAGQPVLDLARGIGRLPGLRLDGIQAFEGHAVYIDDPQQRDQTVRKSFEPAIESRKLLERARHRRAGSQRRIVVHVSDHRHHRRDGRIAGGSYATMDWRYARMLPEFEVALSVLARVISRRGDAAVLDVGLKGAGNEFGLPRIKDDPDAEFPASFPKSTASCATSPVGPSAKRSSCCPAMPVRPATCTGSCTSTKPDASSTSGRSRPPAS
jgi:D-serine deaminase-like pyridoxal phosphate-dependent protein